MLSLNGLKKRAQIIQLIRSFFTGQGYIEIETPVRLANPIPEAHIEPIPSGNSYLQTSPELYMKRLLAQGVPKIFQICKCFRRRERGRLHHEEFTMLEWYSAGADYTDLMADCRELLLFLLKGFGLHEQLTYQGKEISFTQPWHKFTLAEAFANYGPVSLDQAIMEDRFEEVLVEHVEPGLPGDRPVILYDYPAKLGSLAKLKKDNPEVAERFELYIGGLEIANGFSELTEADEQRQRFEKELETIASLRGVKGRMPEQFLTDLGNMPESAGIALGVDRLVMLFLDAACIDDAVAFAPECE